MLVDFLYKQASQFEERDNHLYIRRFLLDTSVNLNQWGVSVASIGRNINSFIGRPFVLTQALDHPLVEHESVEHNLAYQEQFRIGTIIDVVRDGTRYDAIIEITNKDAAEMIRAGSIPVYVSPAIAHGATNDDTNIDEWIGIHLAVVDKPAFGVKKTSKASHCDGTKESCLMVLRKASIEKNGVGSCGFCVKKALQQLVSKDISSLNSSHVDDANSNVVMASNAPDVSTPTSNVPAVKGKKQAPKSAKEIKKKVGKKLFELLETTRADYESKIASIIASKDAEIAALKKATTEFESKVATIQTERRKEQISGVIGTELYSDPKVREEMINKFASTSLSIEDIKATVAPLVETKSKLKKASVNTDIPYTSAESDAPVLAIPSGVVI